MNVFPTTYLPSIAYISLVHGSENPYIDIYENYHKQTLRSRTEILTASGRYSLTVPTVKQQHHVPVIDITIGYQENWPQHHWKSLYSAYAKAPFFIYYSDPIKDIIFSRHTHLLSLNMDLLKYLLPLFGIEKEIILSEKYIEPEKSTQDFRPILSKPNMTHGNFTNYGQTFGYKFPFQPNLSAIDLLFNMGPEAYSYLSAP